MGDRVKPTSRDVAALADVSPATVSRVFRGAFNGPETVRAGVLEAAAQLGYRPNVSAQQMRTGRSNRVQLVVRSVVDPGVPELVAAFIEVARSRGLGVVLSVAEQAGSSWESASQSPAGQVDGVVWLGPHPSDRVALRAVAGSVPVVVVGGVGTADDLVDPVDTIDSVEVDGVQAGQTVAHYFADNGRLRVALIGPIGSCEAAVSGFRRGVRAFDLHLDAPAVVDCDDSETASSEAIARLASRELPSAIFDGLRRLGLVAPVHTWVCGLGDWQAASLVPYQLSVVRTEPREIAEAALSSISARIKSPTEGTRRIVLKTELVVRGSTNGIAQAPARRVR